ncbi:MAG: type II toxin-antitoxin system Phd/YefM family antitoxin [Rhodospirillaceae bacterium]|nr:type II toxin-antitoxin system Phd/YefM family antitoxin [Rhodospirillaceae bacterium]MYB13890.1 type II toxin-antitoxin system Phd/YefM family antitoxin [Rhodospirillaceae bacterium]MYI48721.1 type II toxin-antitoxin system Phd/YefM family antitoxin [Rhodospirillaceae bacterium]
MKEFAARDARNRFGRLLDAAQRAPVQVTRNGRATDIVMSVQEYERLRGAAWDRLTATMDAMGERAEANGLTEIGLEALLADES